MNFWLVNESLNKELGASLQQIASALSTQLYRDYAPMWQAQGAVVLVATTDPPTGSDDVAVHIRDADDNPGALGDHETTSEGRPVGRIFLDPILQNGGTIMTGDLSVSSVISHEVLEIIGDPYATWWADAPDGYEYALELCDPVEGDSYNLDGVMVSNFVGPRYFSYGPGPYDFMEKLSKPFSMTDGGYLIRRTPGGNVSQVFAASYPVWRKATKRRHLLRAGPTKQRGHDARS